MNDAYLHRVIRDKLDVNSVLEKEEPIGVGQAFPLSGFDQLGVGIVPKVLFYYNSNTKEMSVRTLTGTSLTLIASGFGSSGVKDLYVDQVNHIVFFVAGLTQIGIWTGNTIYKFSYNPDTGLPTIAEPFTVVATMAGQIDCIFADGVEQKIYYNGDTTTTGLERSNYDGSNVQNVVASFGNPNGIWKETGSDILYVADTGIGRIIKVDFTLGLPGTSSVWFQEDSAVFGPSTWFDWADIDVDPSLGLAFIHPSGSQKIRTVSWPIAPPTPTSHPPAYSKVLFESSSSLGMVYSPDTVNHLLYLHNNGDSVTYRYDYSNGLMERETIMVDLIGDPLAVSNMSLLRAG